MRQQHGVSDVDYNTYSLETQSRQTSSDLAHFTARLASRNCR